MKENGMMNRVFAVVCLVQVLCAVHVWGAINPRWDLRVKMIHTPLGNIEEPASVFASFLGLVVSAVNLLRMRSALQRLPSGSWAHYPFKSLWYLTVGGISAMSAASVVFHAHENKVTEGMDYTTAIWFIGMMSCASMLRCFRVCRTAWHRVVPFVLMLAPLCWHSHYMFFVSFDYGWNMKFGAFFVAVTVLTWYGLCAYELLVARPRSRHFAWALAAITALTLFAPAEMHDFIPLWHTIDGHSVWHLGMDVFAALFGEFVVRDVAYYASKDSDPLLSRDPLHTN